MPIYQKLENGFPKGEGLLEDRIQFHTEIAVSEDFISGKNVKNKIAAMGSNKGIFLVSDGFYPCQAVVAWLKDGDMALYHAYTPFDCTSLQNFVSLIKGNVESILVFQKSSPEKNLMKAPILAVALTHHLGIEVSRLHVDKHVCVVTDARNSCVILTNKIKYIPSGQQIDASELPQTGFGIDLNKAIPIETSVQQVLDQEENRGEKFENFTIPEYLLQKSKSSLNFNQLKK